MKRLAECPICGKDRCIAFAEWRGYCYRFGQSWVRVKDKEGNYCYHTKHDTGQESNKDLGKASENQNLFELSYGQYSDE